MIKRTKLQSKPAINPQDISRYKKERFLLTLSEDDFRDRVVRPVFFRLGFQDGRDLCGQDEEGKDAIFIETDRFGTTQMHAVQTKRGKLNMSSKPIQNVQEAITQMRTAMATKFVLLKDKVALYPTSVILCTSGKINQSARKHINAEVNDTRIRFMDSDDLIPKIDEMYPEFWYGIDATKFPYLRNLKYDLLQSSDTISLSELDIRKDLASPISDDMYVQLHLHRVYAQQVKRSGKINLEPKFEQLPFQAVLKRKERLIHVVGEAGTGKTTSIRRLAYSIAEKSLSTTSANLLPILARAKDIAENDNPLVDNLYAATSRFLQGNKSCFSTSDLEMGLIVALIDALDEAPAEKREVVLAKIIAFNKQYPKCTIVLTSRDYSSTTSLPGLGSFLRFSLTPIDIRQAEKILTRLEKGKGLPAEEAKEMLRRLHDVHGMDLTPLMVTVFVATSDYNRRDIPANITELFKKFTEMMLGRWDQRKGLSQQYQATVKDYLLKELGFYMHKNHMTLISIEECRRFFRERLISTGHEADWNALFEETIYRSALLRPEGEELSFRHHLLQEFFAGRGVPDVTFFQNIVVDDWWKNPLIFYFGENPTKHNELMKLIKSFENCEADELYRAAVAVGLAVQACYLSRVQDKNASMDWVISGLARAKESFLAMIDKGIPNRPVMAFVNYYLFARDSVACKSLSDHSADVARQDLQAKNLTPIRECEIFWRIVSLIESGQFNVAKELVKKFHPSDGRYLLALHLGCFLISNLNTYSNEDRKTAEQVASIIAPHIPHLRMQVLKEFTSMLLEVRKGKISVVQVITREDKSLEE